MISPLQFGGSANEILTLVYLAFFFVFVVFGQQIQYYISIGGVSRSLDQLSEMRDRAMSETLDLVRSKGRSSDPQKELSKLIEFVTIMPETLDPAGVVGKMEQVVKGSDIRMRGEVQRILGTEDPLRVSVVQNMVEITSSLNTIYKVVRHVYLSSRKTRSYFTLLQLQASLPQIMDMADSLSKATEPISKGEPLGDGLGPLVASKLMAGTTAERIARDTVVSKTAYRGRTLYVVKAEGPMGWVGEPDVAIRKIVEEMKADIKIIVMADAALKLEGEKTGELVEGMGAAIGGIGTEKFRIEEVASGHSIPIYAILVRESQEEAITAMRKEVAEASQGVLDALAAVVEGKTTQGDSVIFAGIGNTLGIGQ